MCNSPRPKVSTVTPSYNSAETIETLLSSIRRQTYPNIEIIVVDNFSSDGTEEISKKYTGMVISHKSERSEARNIGVKHATGKYVFFLDSDLELTSFIVERCVDACERQHLDGVIIPEKSKGNTFWAKCRNFEKAAYLNDKHKMSVLFMRKAAFEAVGGYDVNLVAGEDYDFNVRFSDAGYRSKMISEYMYHHETISFANILRKSYHYGKTMPRYIEKRPKGFIDQFFPLRKSYFQVNCGYTVSFSCVIGLVIMKVAQYFAALVGVFAAKISRVSW